SSSTSTSTSTSTNWRFNSLTLASGSRGIMAKKTPNPTGKALVIVESPAKARTISKFLGKGFAVEASIGHIRDLPEGKKEMPEELRHEDWAYLGVNVHKNFEPVYVVSHDKKE